MESLNHLGDNMRLRPRFGTFIANPYHFSLCFFRKLLRYFQGINMTDLNRIGGKIKKSEIRIIWNCSLFNDEKIE